jgi:hypothetical protein
MEPDLQRIVELACLAPSVHNTQPWRWCARGRTIELQRDAQRMLPVADPRGRNLAISCGAALHHAQVAARALGWKPVVTRPERGVGEDVVARIELEPAPANDESIDQLGALRTRFTDRRRFTSWPIPAGKLHALANVARLWGAIAVPVVESRDRVRVELLVNRALDRQRSDGALMNEQACWLDRGPVDGIPADVVPPPEEQSGLGDRFNVPVPESSDRQTVEVSDGVLVLCGDSDDEAAWLTTGEALSALWLAATRNGLAVVPLSQVIEVEETRNALQSTLLGGLTVPHLLVRIGWQSIGRRQLHRTSRRPLLNVLVPAGPRVAG